MGLRGCALGLTVGRKACQAGPSRCPPVTVGLVILGFQPVVEIPEGYKGLTFMPKGWERTHFLRIWGWEADIKWGWRCSVAGLGPEGERIHTARGQATSTFTAYTEPPRTGPGKPTTHPKNYPREAFLCLHRMLPAWLSGGKTHESPSPGSCQLTLYPEGSWMGWGLGVANLNSGAEAGWVGKGGA